MPADSPDLVEVLIADLGGLKLVERGAELGLALSVSRDGLADVVQYARAHPDDLVVGENVRWLSWDAWDRLVRAAEAHRSLRATPARPLPRVTAQPPPLPASVPPLPASVPPPPPRTTRLALPDVTHTAIPEESDDGS